MTIIWLDTLKKYIEKESIDTFLEEEKKLASPKLR